MSRINELQRLTEQQLPQAIAMIGRAFHKDPLSAYIYPDEAERTRRLPLVFSIALHHIMHSWELYAASNRGLPSPHVSDCSISGATAC